MGARDDFHFISGDPDSASFVDSLHHDDRELPDLWTQAPKTAEAIAFWLAINDVYEFAVCFKITQSIKTISAASAPLSKPP